MKAYQVEDRHEGVSDIVFAETSEKAKARAIAKVYFHSDFTDIKVQRVPWADQYSKQGFVPKQEMLTQGWIFECVGCLKFQDDETAIVKNNQVYCENCHPDK